MQLRVESIQLTPGGFSENHLRGIDVVLFDLQDSASSALGSGWKTAADWGLLERFQTSGGGIIWTHDWLSSHTLNLSFYERIGIYYSKLKVQTGMGNKARIIKRNSIITNMDTRINLLHDPFCHTFKVGLTHQSHYKVDDGKIVCILEDDGGHEMGEYLVVKENEGAGKGAYWAAGHTSNLEQKEILLLVNLIMWMKREHVSQ